MQSVGQADLPEDHKPIDAASPWAKQRKLSSRDPSLVAREPAGSSYPNIEAKIPSTMDAVPWKSFIYAYDEDNITIKGEGMIQPNGEHEVFQDGVGNSPKRPYGIHLVKCRNVQVRSVRLINSAFWMQRYFECEDLKIHGMQSL